tara:strand:- start:2382 stop:3101 length:720 start_codon:yes stop_codon:yes gene_type:complete
MSNISFEKVYGDFVEHKNEQNRLERYEGNEEWYGSSSSGSCIRKLYYKHKLRQDISNPISEESYRKMRLGTVFHDDMEKALEFYNKKKDRKVKFHYEDEIRMPEYNVRGFYDCVMECEDGSIYLYDFKTIASTGWRFKFGPRAKTSEDPRYSMQLGMYGVGVKEKFGRIDGMGLVYYNKDTSAMRVVDVPLEWMEKAKDWWANVMKEHSIGLPPLMAGISPAASWECGYCEYQDTCLGI